MKNRVVHFEIPSSKPDETMKFFKDVFDWKFQQMEGEEYWLATTGKEEGGIDGAIMKRMDPAQPVTNSIDVEDFDAAIDKIVKAGGKIVVPKSPVPGMGWFGHFTDPDGNIHGLWQNDESAA